MYRGMHHPLDTLAGVLVGIAALTLVVFVAALRALSLASMTTREREPG